MKVRGWQSLSYKFLRIIDDVGGWWNVGLIALFFWWKTAIKMQRCERIKRLHKWKVGESEMVLCRFS
jgi:hypothetical protein